MVFEDYSALSVFDAVFYIIFYFALPALCVNDGSGANASE